MLIKVNVTEDDIKNGIKGDCNKCPIALAFKRIYPTDDVLVDGISVSLNEDSDPILLPGIARDFIDEFDFTTNDCKPFSFEIEI